MKGDVISDHFLMLWFQKDSLDTIGFRTFRFLVGWTKVTFGFLNVPLYEIFLNFTNFFSASLKYAFCGYVVSSNYAFFGLVVRKPLARFVQEVFACGDLASGKWVLVTLPPRSVPKLKNAKEPTRAALP